MSQHPFTTPGLTAFAQAIDTERQQQLTRWGEQRHPDGTGRRGYIEKAHIARVTCQMDSEITDGGPRWSLVLLEEVYEALAESDPARLRAELVQVAAVCAAWITDLDRRSAAADPDNQPIPYTLATDQALHDRPRPETSMALSPATRDQIATMLRQGATHDGVRHRLGVSHRAVRDTRKAQNIPYQPPTPRPVEQTFLLYAAPTSDDHARWTGPWAGRMPQICHGARKVSARRVSFALAHGREPDGNVTPGCGDSACIAGSHLVDRPMRAARRKDSRG